MNKLICALAALIALGACATTDAKSEAPSDPDRGTAALDLDQAIARAAADIREKLPGEEKIAVVSFASESANLSDYLMEELNFALLAEGMSVIDRANLDAARRELNFQASGEVSDESALSLGRFLGARYALSGQFRLTGADYRLAITAVDVESAARAAWSRVNVRGDEKTRKLVETIGRADIRARSAGY
jgi:TolB-like protein